MLNLGCGQYLRNPFFSRILGSKVGVRVLYSCGLYSAVYGKWNHSHLKFHLLFYYFQNQYLDTGYIFVIFQKYPCLDTLREFYGVYWQNFNSLWCNVRDVIDAIRVNNLTINKGILNLGRYIEYTVGNLVISYRISDDIPPQMKILNMVNPHSNALLQFYLKLER